MAPCVSFRHKSSTRLTDRDCAAGLGPPSHGLKSPTRERVCVRLPQRANCTPRFPEPCGSAPLVRIQVMWFPSPSNAIVVGQHAETHRDHKIRDHFYPPLAEGANDKSKRNRSTGAIGDRPPVEDPHVNVQGNRNLRGLQKYGRFAPRSETAPTTSRYCVSFPGDGGTSRRNGSELVLRPRQAPLRGGGHWLFLE